MKQEEIMGPRVRDKRLSVFLETWISVHFQSLKRSFCSVMKRPIRISFQSLTHSFLCPSSTSCGPPKAHEYIHTQPGDGALKEKVTHAISGDALPASCQCAAGLLEGSGPALVTPYYRRAWTRPRTPWYL